jgi:hypothetical protein
MPVGLAGGPPLLEALVPWLDTTSLADTGWGLIFPKAADSKQVEKILDALKILLEHRKQAAGDLFKIYYNPEASLPGWKTLEGYQPGDDKDRFLQRHKAGGPGPVDPGAHGVPYYLLIVADPQSIPYEFQFGLDAQYAVGRIYFDRLEDYARYAASLVTAEKDPKLRLARRAAFFGPANPGDGATQLSAENLVKPLAGHVTEMAANSDLGGWSPELIAPEDATKQRLGELLSGGKHSPALLFTASHGIGWPYGDPKQYESQGALLCQDWPGPGSGLLSEDYYFSAHDLPSDANLLGMIAFTFACYGAGTPEWDHFSTVRSGYKRRLAARSFLAALPSRLLSMERGGALAVVGHVERAWGYSFKWPQSGVQTAAFKSVLYSLMKGDPVGVALEDMNERYTQIAAQLSEALQAEKGDASEMTFLWTANNDARGYVVIGDPAARLPQARDGQTARPRIQPVEIHGELPAMLAPQLASQAGTEAVDFGAGAPQGGAGEDMRRGYGPPGVAAAPGRPYTLLDGLLSMEQIAGAAEEEAFDIGDDIRESVNKLREIFTNMTQRLGEFTREMTTLEVKTFSVSNMDARDKQLDEKLRNRDPGLSARLHACTHIKMDGDVDLFLPAELKEEDRAMLPVHNDLTAQAMANRADLIRAAVEALASLISPK